MHLFVLVFNLSIVQSPKSWRPSPSEGTRNARWLPALPSVSPTSTATSCERGGRTSSTSYCPYFAPSCYPSSSWRPRTLSTRKSTCCPKKSFLRGFCVIYNLLILVFIFCKKNYLESIVYFKSLWNVNFYIFQFKKYMCFFFLEVKSYIKI